MLKHPKIGTNYFLGIFLNLKILFSAFLQNDGFSPLGLTVTNELDIQLEVLRWLLYLSHELHYLSHKGYEVASIKVAEIGKILGGLYKSI